jgi:hypothetical protein
LGTHFLVIVGFAAGLIGGMAYLIAATRQADAERKAARRRDGVEQGSSQDAERQSRTKPPAE